MTKRQLLKVVEMVGKLGIVRSREFDAAGINRKFVSVALKNGLIRKVARGIYVGKDFAERREARVMVACKRTPSAVLCLASAAHFHGLLDQEPEKVWIAIDEKTWDASANTQVKRAWFSGAAMTQGVVNRKIGGVTIRVYSPMKTIADLLKYRNKIGIETAIAAMHGSIRTKQYSPYRLLHFARICRVERLAGSCIRQVGSGREFEGRQPRSDWKERV